MAPLSGDQATTLPAKWHRYPGGRLERYLQNGAVIRMADFTHKTRKKKISYNIYGFAINRIYSKNSTICISRFFGGGQGRREIIFRCENKTVSIDSSEKNSVQCRQSWRRS